MEDKIVVAVKGIIRYNGRILIIQRSDYDEIGSDIWECAGGKLEFGETLEDALIREIREEVGLPVTVDKLLYAITQKTNEHRQVVVVAYACTAYGDIVTLSDEHKNYLWANKEQMMDLLAKPIVDDMSRNCVWEQIFPE